MFWDYWKYLGAKSLSLREPGRVNCLARGKVIVPAEVKVQELEETRKAIAEELLKQRTV